MVVGELMIVKILMTRAISAGVYVGATGFTGWQIASTVGSLIGVVISVGSLSLYVAASGRSKRQAYDEELADARKAGADGQRQETLRERDRANQLAKDLEFYRNLAWQQRNPGAPQLPDPPSRRRQQPKRDEPR